MSKEEHYSIILNTEQWRLLHTTLDDVLFDTRDRLKEILRQIDEVPGNKGEMAQCRDLLQNRISALTQIREQVISARE